MIRVDICSRMGQLSIGRKFQFWLILFLFNNEFIDRIIQGGND